MRLYVSNDEIKTYLGITSTSEDGKIGMLNKFATDQLNRMLSVSDASAHLVTDEIHDGVGNSLIRLNELNPREIVKIMDGDTEYTQDDAYDLEGGLLRLAEYPTGGRRKLKVTYVAGWYAAGWVKVTVSDYSAIAGGKKITITLSGGNALVLTAGTNFTVETSNEVTAENIAAAVNAGSGVHAFAVGADVYVIDDTPQRATSTIAYDGNGITLGAATLSGAIDFPESLRLAICLLVAGQRAKTKAAGVKRYTIAGKSVEFEGDADRDQFVEIVNGYKRVNVLSV